LLNAGRALIEFDPRVRERTWMSASCPWAACSRYGFAWTPRSWPLPGRIN